MMIPYGGDKLEIVILSNLLIGCVDRNICVHRAVVLSLPIHVAVANNLKGSSSVP